MAGGRIQIRNQHHRWEEVRVRLKLQKHEDVAKVLLDTWFQVHDSNGKAVVEVSQSETETAVISDSDTDIPEDKCESDYVPSSSMSSDEDNDFESEDADAESDESDDLYVPSIGNADMQSTFEDIPIVDVGDYVHDVADDRSADELVSPTIVRDMTSMDAITDRKSIVFEKCLLDLAASLTSQLGPCTLCKSKLTVEAKYVGSAVYLKWICTKGHQRLIWCSQPKYGNLHAGDFIQSCSILTSGNNYAKLSLYHKFLNLGFVNTASFYRIQRHYCVPVIEEYWQNLQSEIWDRLRGKQLVLSGDGRNDSPGHSAHYCTYTVMEQQTKSIVDLQVIDKRETGLKSPNMEKLGLTRALNNLASNGLEIAEIVTDGHLQISYMMKNDFPGIKHSHDIWHAAKNFSKKLTAVASERKNSDLKPWIPDIVNHFWFSSKTCSGSEYTLRSKMTGLLHHVVDDHRWISADGWGPAACEHGPLQDHTKPWLEPDGESHRTLRSLLFDVRWQNNLHYYTNFRHTGDLEIFNNHLLMYASKRFAYSYPVYKVRNMLAAIDYQKHKDRPQVVGKDGSLQYNRIFFKKTQNWSVFDVKQKKSYDYIPELIAACLDRFSDGSVSMKDKMTLPDTDPRSIASTIATKRPPPTDQLVKMKKSRF